MVYDPWGARFIMLIDTTSGLLIAVSNQSSALGRWCNYNFPIPNFVDYPELGVDANGIYFGVNVYKGPKSTDPFLYDELFSVSRTQLENTTCPAYSYTYWTNLKDPDGGLAFSIVPVVKYDYYTNYNEEYFVSSKSGGACALTLWKLSNSLLYKYSVATRCYSVLPAASQKGSTGTIDSNDERLYQATYLKRWGRARCDFYSYRSTSSGRTRTQPQATRAAVSIASSAAPPIRPMATRGDMLRVRSKSIFPSRVAMGL